MFDPEPERHGERGRAVNREHTDLELAVEHIERILGVSCGWRSDQSGKRQARDEQSVLHHATPNPAMKPVLAPDSIVVCPAGVKTRRVSMRNAMWGRLKPRTCMPKPSASSGRAMR